MKLKCAYGIVPGVSGSEQEPEYQIKIFKKNGVTGIAFSANAAASVIAERFEEFYSSKEDVVRKAVQEATAKTSGSDNSLLFVAVKKNRYLAGHMGGGLIAVLSDGCSVLSKPETGNRKADLKIFRGELQEPFGFMLLSDGACLSLYESDAGKLSPACGTFFDWLKEYDEETVSGALADNIDKYFIKETKGDIGVAVMVSGEGEEDAEGAIIEVETAKEDGVENTAPPEEDEQTAAPPEEDELDAEPAELAEEESEPAEEEGEPIEESVPVEELAKETAKSSKYIKYLIAAALIVILAVVVVLTASRPGDTGQKDQGKAGGNPPAALSDSSKPAAVSETTEPGVSFAVDNPKSYDAGTYQVGEDIPAGEYFFWTGEMLKPDSVKVNDFTCLSGELYCLTVQVNNGDTLTSDYRFTAAGNVNPVVAGDGVLISGKYKIGKDIAPGTYKISPLDQNAEGKYYSILNGEISNDETFSSETTVNVPKEGYIVFYNSALTVK